jgi:hypothetical protein
LDGIEPQPALDLVTIESPDVRSEGDRAVLSGTFNVQFRHLAATTVVREMFCVEFVRRDGRWLVVKSEVITQ